MALRTNTKKAAENIRQYIINNFDGTNYDIETPDTFEEIAKIIYNTFKAEKGQDNRRTPERDLFADWAAGLPSILDTCYYYNREAREDLGNILEQTEAERNRYTEAAAENLLTNLIYREIKKVI